MIHLVLSDTEAGRLMAQALLLNGLATTAESDGSPQLGTVDERMKHALDRLKAEKLIRHGYDYVWIMRYVNEQSRTKGDLWFDSVKSYYTYVKTYMGQSGIDKPSTLSLYYSYGGGNYPDWTFSDTQDATERLRRINVARRFVVLFTKDF